MKRRTTKRTGRAASRELATLAAKLVRLRALKDEIAELEEDVRRTAEDQRREAHEALRDLGDPAVPGVIFDRTPTKKGSRGAPRAVAFFPRGSKKDRDAKPENPAVAPDVKGESRAKIVAYLATVPQARLPEIQKATGAPTPGAAGQALSALVEAGLVVRIKRGLYRGAGAPGLEVRDRAPRAEGPVNPKANGKSESDALAIAWARANPGDHRSARILKLHGLAE